MAKYILLLFFALLAGCSETKQQLNLFFYPEYLGPKVVADFEKQFDCKLVIDFYETVDAMKTKLAAGGVSTYDIVIASDNTLPGMVKSGILAPLRPENIPNLKNIDPQFVNPLFDPGNQYGVPYQWGTDALYVRKPKNKPVEETWGLIFDPAKQLGPFLLTEDVRSCLGAALQYKGYSVNTTNT